MNVMAEIPPTSWLSFGTMAMLLAARICWEISATNVVAPVVLSIVTRLTLLLTVGCVAGGTGGIVTVFRVTPYICPSVGSTAMASTLGRIGLKHADRRCAPR